MKRQLEYPDRSVYDHLRKYANEYSGLCALEYYGRKISYRDLLREVNRCACALAAAGVKKGDSISICLPNIPQAVYLFYAVNKLGAVANMIHPMSAEKEILDYIDLTDSRYIFAIDLIAEKLEYISDRVAMKRIVTVSAADEMSLIYKTGYHLKSLKERPKKYNFIDWKEFISKASPCDKYINAHGRPDDCAAILYSGGTTGKPKGIMLTNLNFNALALQSIDACGCLEKGDRVLSVMPVFHGFGLGVCIHTVLTFGGTAVIMPRFRVNEFDKLLFKYYPNVIAGVPAIYEAMLRSDGYGCECTVREGYGLTECVTGSCLTPDGCTDIDTCGLPYADTYYKIIDINSGEELPFGETGEIILRGPTVMKGYYKEPAETANTLKADSEGNIWLHTGDLGTMNEEGYVYFRQRLKRMIVTNGYNIYPQNIENVISSHRSVAMCAVVGIPDERRGQIAKAFVMLRDGANENRVHRELEEILGKNVAAYAIPKEIKFVNSFPKTLVGKIAYNELIAEELKNGRE